MAACIVGNMLDLVMFLAAGFLIYKYFESNYSQIKLFAYTIVLALVMTLLAYMRGYEYRELLGDDFYVGKVCKFIGTIVMVYLLLTISIIYNKFNPDE